MFGVIEEDDGYRRSDLEGGSSQRGGRRRFRILSAVSEVGPIRCGYMAEALAPAEACPRAGFDPLSDGSIRRR